MYIINVNRFSHTYNDMHNIVVSWYYFLKLLLLWYGIRTWVWSNSNLQNRFVGWEMPLTFNQFFRPYHIQMIHFGTLNTHQVLDNYSVTRVVRWWVAQLDRLWYHLRIYVYPNSNLQKSIYKVRNISLL